MTTPHSRPLRVLAVSHLFPQNASSSQGSFVRDQLTALAAHAEVSVVVGRYGAVPTRAPVSSPGTPTVAEVSLPAYRPAPLSLAVAAAVRPYLRRARRVALESGPFDVVHAHYAFPDGVVGVRLARELGAPVVVTLHGSDYARQLSRPLFGALIGRRLQTADALVGVGPHIAEGLRQRFQLGEDRVLCLPNGYDSRTIHVHAARTPRYFLFVGALLPLKNPHLLLNAYASIADRTALDLVFVGDGPLREGLELSAHRRGLGDRVRFEGARPHAEVDGYLKDAAALVLPSDIEGMPIVVNEALASGTPVVASRLPGIELQVRDERFGLLVPPRDVPALADALQRVSVRTWDHGAIARDCGVRTWDEYALELLALYRRLTGVACDDALEAADA